MAKVIKANKENSPEGGDEQEVIQVVPEKGPIDLTTKVQVEITEDEKYHGEDKKHHYQPGEVIECSPTVAEKIVKNKWGKIVTMIALFVLASFGAMAQQDFLSPFTTAANRKIDSVTNTGTNYVTAQRSSTGSTTAVEAYFNKISGTPAGTVTLQGSIDGVNYGTIAPLGVALGTFTPTNVQTQAYVWVVTGSPCPYYRVSYTGAGTMVVTVGAKIYTHN